MSRVCSGGGNERRGDPRLHPVKDEPSCRLQPRHYGLCC